MQQPRGRGLGQRCGPPCLGGLATMKKSLRWWMLGLMAALVTAGFAQALRSRTIRTGAMDGVKVRCLGVSFGTNHYGPPERWNRLKAAAPQRFLSWIRRPRPMAIRLPRPECVVWLEIAGSAGIQDAAAIDLRCEWSGGAEALNLIPFRRLTDFATAGASGLPLAPKTSPSEWTRLAFATPLVPHRASTLSLRVLPGSALQERTGGVRFEVPNPSQESFPAWGADPLPAGVEAGGIDIRLTGFDVERAATGAPPLRWATARLDLRAGDRDLAGWHVDALELCDPTGNQLRGVWPLKPGALSFRSTPTGGGSMQVMFRWPGWSEEPVWRMTLGLRPGEDNLGPGDKAAGVSGVVVPDDAGITWIRRDVVLGGYSVQVLALAGQHASLPDRPHDVQGQFTLELDLAPLAEEWGLAVQAVDAQGRSAAVGGAGLEDMRSLGLRIQPEAETLDLTFTLYRKREASFLVGE